MYWHNRRCAQGTMGFGAKAEKWDACDPSLKSFAHMAVAAQIGCSFCLDYGYFQAFNGTSTSTRRARYRAGATRRCSPAGARGDGLRRGDDRDAAEVTDDMVAHAARELGDAALVELTAYIALANMYTRSNVALGIEAEGYAASCDLRAARDPERRRTLARMSDDPFVATAACCSRSPTSCSARPPTPRTWCRRLVAVGRDRRGRPGRGARPPRIPGTDREPAGAQPAAHAGPPQGGLRRRVAARAAADHPGRGRGRRAGRERVHRDAHGAGDARRRPSAPCSCCTRCSTCPSTRSPPRRGRRRRLCARSRIARDRTSPRGGRGWRSTARNSDRRSTGSCAALRTGDLQALMDALAPDAVLIADGGGVVSAVRAPVIGAKKIVNLLGGSRGSPRTAVIEPVLINGAPGVASCSTASSTRSSVLASRTDGSAGSSRSATRKSCIG